MEKIGKLELPLPSKVIQEQLQKVVDIVSLGLQMAETGKIQDLSIPNSTFQIAPAQNKKLDIETAKREYIASILANGLRDSLEIIGISLEWARKFCFIWTRDGETCDLEDGKFRLSAEITGEEWNKGIIEEAKSFEKKGLKDKIYYLNKEYDFVYPEFTEKVLSINKARNCLVHRLGIVNELDIRNSPTSSLIVEWVKLAIVKRDGDKEYELKIPVTLAEGDMIRPIIMECSKEFHLGDRIEFDRTEFLNIITTFLLFSQQIEQSILDIQNKRKPDW